MNHDKLVNRNKKSNLTSWISQKQWVPISMVRGDGVYFWDADGKRYLDWSSQLMNVNIGHGNPKVIQAIKDQIEKLSFAYPGIATEPRARLGEFLADITPKSMNKTFFTLGGADGIENAIKFARLSTGKQKVVTRYRAYHGATFGAMTAGGDPRRLANEPGVPWIVRVHDPYAYRSPIYRGRTQAEGDQALVDLIEDTIKFEGPEYIAAILLEGYSGSSGIIQGGDTFWKGIQRICDQYEILLIIDEVMSGFGRTGKWFGFNHYPYVTPDMIVMAKGLTSGYVPLGAVTVSDDIADYFEGNTLWGGLTYSAHPLGCAAGVANIEVYQDQGLIDNSHEMGKVLRQKLLDLAESHPSVGDIRGVGLHQVIELVKDKGSREPLGGFNQPLSEPMQVVAKSLRANGMSTFVKWNWIFCCPPLIITEGQINEGIDIIHNALKEIDSF
jgi:taurine--2-oxoglutarate transaminase